MKFIKVSQKELKDITELYEEVMGDAYEGLFYQEGKSIGKGIMDIISAKPGYRKKAGNLIKAKGWAEEIFLKDNVAIVEGSIEVSPPSETPTCHRLRGIIYQIYEAGTKELLDVEEVECQSMGDKHCKFEINKRTY
ncbi:MAG: V4R domain-containing protein [Thermoplasmatota archaeon]